MSLTRNTQFDYGTDQIDLTHQNNLNLDLYFEEIVALLNQDPSKSVQITGHTCDDSSEAFNINLGLKRAESIRRALIKRGIEANRITSATDGETHPLADNMSLEGKQVNRRVELVIR
jgi:outer membrane protein OmpA-like peptidoglycan-associated protein